MNEFINDHNFTPQGSGVKPPHKESHYYLNDKPPKEYDQRQVILAGGVGTGAVYANMDSPQVGTSVWLNNTVFNTKPKNDSLIVFNDGVIGKCIEVNNSNRTYLVSIIGPNVRDLQDQITDHINNISTHWNVSVNADGGLTFLNGENII